MCDNINQFGKSLMVKRALITGITGQDGSYLAEFLVRKGYKVFGMVRRTSTDPLVRLEDLYFKDNVVILNGDLRDMRAIERVIKESDPDEVYNLAAQSDVGVSFQCPEETMEINFLGAGRLVNAAIKHNPKIKIYQASTSDMFGKTKPPQNETSSFHPVSPYGESKLKAHQDFVVEYREKHNLFICSGILFNHESPRRGKHFVTRKITHSMVKIKLGFQDYFELGNLEAKRDWGFAGDYVEAMWLMLQMKKPMDFVISSGKSHNIKDFVNATANALGMKVTWHGKGLKEVARNENGKLILKVNPDFYRPREVGCLVGDSRLARKFLKWKPKVDFDELVKMMVASDLKLVAHENLKEKLLSI